MFRTWDMQFGDASLYVLDILDAQRLLLLGRERRQLWWVAVDGVSRFARKNSNMHCFLFFLCDTDWSIVYVVSGVVCCFLFITGICWMLTHCCRQRPKTRSRSKPQKYSLLETQEHDPTSSECSGSFEWREYYGILLLFIFQWHVPVCYPTAKPIRTFYLRPRQSRMESVDRMACWRMGRQSMRPLDLAVG